MGLLSTSLYVRDDVCVDQVHGPDGNCLALGTAMCLLSVLQHVHPLSGAVWDCAKPLEYTFVDMLLFPILMFCARASNSVVHAC